MFLCCVVLIMSVPPRFRKNCHLPPPRWRPTDLVSTGEAAPLLKYHSLRLQPGWHPTINHRQRRPAASEVHSELTKSGPGEYSDPLGPIRWGAEVNNNLATWESRIYFSKFNGRQIGCQKQTCLSQMSRNWRIFFDIWTLKHTMLSKRIYSRTTQSLQYCNNEKN